MVNEKYNLTAYMVAKKKRAMTNGFQKDIKKEIKKRYKYYALLNDI